MKKISITTEHSPTMLWISAISNIILGFLFLLGIVISALSKEYWFLICVIPSFLMFWKAKRTLAILDKG